MQPATLPLSFCAVVHLGGTVGVVHGVIEAASTTGGVVEVRPLLAHVNARLSARRSLVTLGIEELSARPRHILTDREWRLCASG